MKSAAMNKNKGRRCDTCGELHDPKLTCLKAWLFSKSLNVRKGSGKDRVEIVRYMTI